MKLKKLLAVISFFLIVLPVLVISVKPTLNDDVLGLIVFKADLQDPEGKLSSWNEYDDIPCNWFGVVCSPRSNRVTELNLDGLSLSGHLGRGLLRLEFLRKLSLAKNNLTGRISPSIARIDHLRVLDLSENGFSGEVSEEFLGQCGSLRVLNLASNVFSGRIPDSLGSCSMLAAVNLSSNRFSGGMPSSIWSLSGLRSIDLSGNLLEGEVPKGIEGMNNLRTLNLRKNRLSGGFLDGVGSCLLLRFIDVSENALSGYFPESLQKLSLLSYLNLRQNLFHGEVPQWIGDMRFLETLDLAGNEFSGEVPSSIGKLKLLKILKASGNSFNGSLPESIVNLENLIELDFSQNSFSGDLPRLIRNSGFQDVSLAEDRPGKNPISSSGENMLKNLQILDLSYNSFSGEISSKIGVLSRLQYLNLSRNSLLGSIPANIVELEFLYALDLSKNKLNGSIPREIGGASSLKVLRLERNYLTGTIPSSIQNCSSLISLFLSQNNLSGMLPAAIAKLKNLQFADFSMNNFTGGLPKQLANLPHIVSFNISNNNLHGELPSGGFFNLIPPSSVSGNPALCGSVVNKTCPGDHQKPFVLKPNSSSDPMSDSLPPDLGHKRKILSISAIIAIGAAVLIVVGVIAITVLNLRVRASAEKAAANFASSAGDDLSHSPTTDANSGKLVMFSGELDFTTGAHALLNKDCELGRGGFGAVYRTVLRDGRPVAIKKLTVSSIVKSQEDFETEVHKLGKIRHPNLVTLDGYYWTPSLQLLIYEFVSGGSLYKHLHEGTGKHVLSWNERFNIILGTAKSLAHLHQSNIIHYNIKSSNVLIDSSGEPKVGDYGLARLLPMLDRYVLSSKIQSALGYMAPEFACRTVKITEKCDVYGFGVLALESITGRRPVEYMEDDVVILCDMVRGALDEGRAEECIDQKLQGKFPVEEAIPVIKLGLICTSQVPSNRPDMGEVVNILELIRCPSEGQEE